MSQNLQEATQIGGVTLRAVFIALVLLLILVPIGFFVEIAFDKADMFVGVPSMTPVVVLFFLAGAASFPLLCRLQLSRRELLVIYSIMLVAGPVFGRTTTAWMMCGTIHYYYMSQVNQIWITTFLSQVPTWFAPTDMLAGEGFFQGHAVVPWNLWATSLAAWGGFMIALFLCAFCIISLLQRQWITNERLSFPLAQMPLEMVGESQPGDSVSIGRLTRIWAFWLGVLISVVLTALNDVAVRWPAVPAIPLGPLPLMSAQPVGPLGGVGEITWALWPWLIAIAYLIPKDLSFSCWLFWWVLVIANVFGVFAGMEPRDPANIWDSGFPAPRFQGCGALIAIGIWALWMARRHLVRALRVALLSRRTGFPDKDEPVAYRFAIIGIIVTLAAMIYFTYAAGCRLFVGAAIVVGILGYYVVWARLRAETGLGFAMFPMELEFLLNTPFGPSFYRVREIVTIMSMRWTYGQGFGTIYEVLSGNALETFKIADVAGINKRRLSKAIMIAFLMMVVLSIYVLLTGIYRYGWLNLRGLQSGWLGDQSISDGGRIIWRLLYHPPHSDVNGLMAMIFGAVFATLLGFMRLRFWWWPLHPVGYMVGMSWGANWYWMPFFVGWVAKSLVVRYGGLRLYRATVPLATGLIIGDLLNRGLWSFIGLLTQGRV